MQLKQQVNFNLLEYIASKMQHKGLIQTTKLVSISLDGKKVKENKSITYSALYAEYPKFHIRKDIVSDLIIHI